MENLRFANHGNLYVSPMAGSVYDPVTDPDTGTEAEANIIWSLISSR